METVVPKIRFSQSIRIVWKRDVDDCVITICQSCVGVFMGNTLLNHSNRIVVSVSRLTDSNSFPLDYLAWQPRGNIVYINVFNCNIVVLHPLMISNRGFSGKNRWVSRNIYIVWDSSTSHLIVVVRRRSCKKLVYPCVIWQKHSW